MFHEQRVGKNLITLAIWDIERPRRILVITTKKGIKVWKKEISESLDLSDWRYAPEIQTINFSQLQRKSRHNRLRKWLDGSTSFMTVDEAHHIKKRGSVWSRRCRALGKKADWRLALTGTPIAQGIWNSWAIFDYLSKKIFGPWTIVEKIPRPGRKPLLRIVGGFQHRYLIMDARWRSKVVGTQNEEEFYEIFHRHSVRKTLAEVKREAGHKATRIRRVVLTGQLSRVERRHYGELEEKLRTVVNQEEISTPLVMTLSMKLQQICGGYLLDESKRAHRLGTSKINLLRPLLVQLREEKPVIVCRFIHELNAIEAMLVAFGYTVKRIQGGTEFDPKEPIHETAILLQIQSGEAIDLAVSSTIIFYSWNYSYIDYEQSRFRILQYMSEKVSYYFLVMANSIDELILEAVQQKKRLADLVCDHYRSAK